MYRRTGVVIISVLFTLPYWQEVMAGMILRPSIAVTERYDSNPYYMSEDARYDFFTSLSPRIEFGKEEKRYTLRGAYGLNSMYYARDQNLNYTSHNASLMVEAMVSKNLTIGLGDTFTYTQESLEATDVGIQVGRGDILSNSVSADINYILSQRTHTGMTLSSSILDFKTSGLLDTRTDSSTIFINYESTPGRTFNVNYGVSNLLFNAPDGGQSILSHSLSLGMTGQLSPTLSFGLSGGAVYIPDIGDHYNWTADLSIEKTFQRSTLSLAYTRGVTNTSGLTDEVNINDRLSAGWDLSLSRLFSVSLYSGFSKSRSEPEGIVDLISYDGGITCMWQPYTWMNMGIGYSHFQQWSDTYIGGDISRDQVFVNLTTFTEWRY